LLLPLPLALALVLAAPAACQTAPACDVGEASVADLQAAMAEGRCTARQITEASLARIERLDRRGPALRSVLAVNPDALAIANRLDAERAAGQVRGPLHGIPVLVKDNLGTADRMPTTAGALALDGVIAPADAHVVARLREAGAVLLGKANLSEWANFRSTHSSSGWSALGGQTRNPYVLDRSPCGSSAGTGAAIAASLAVVGVGTETDGSIVCPSSATGLVGVKPTVGLVSRAGIVPLSHSQDTAGPMARSVRDAAVLLSAMAGPDPADTTSAAAARHAEADYTRVLDADGLRGARLGVLRASHFGDSPDTDRVAGAAVEAMRAAGAVIVDSLGLPGGYGGDEYTVLLYDFKHDLDAYLAAHPTAPVRSLADVIAFNRANAEASMPWFGQEILEMAQAKGPLSDAAYRAALERSRRLARTQIDSLMDAHDLDALVAPTGSPAWPIDLVNGDHFVTGSSQAAAVSGYPNVTVPAGLAHGLPVGISFIGRRWSEPVLLRLAYAFEQATRRRAPPRYLPTLPTER
ncbi:MAG: amidase, partial [Rubricoccaceae bacterium]|nr:amidase [Rubricoccaceae bacterium]